MICHGLHLTTTVLSAWRIESAPLPPQMAAINDWNSSPSRGSRPRLTKRSLRPPVIEPGESLLGLLGRRWVRNLRTPVTIRIHLKGAESTRGWCYF